jgi:ribonuclease-3
LGKDLKLIQFVESKVNPQHFSENIYGNIFEGLIGAIYLDRGFEYCENFISKKVLKPYVNIPQLEGKVISYKSLIIEWCQKEKKKFIFEPFEDTGNEDQRFFGVKLIIDEKTVSRARETSKKRAEEKAAKRAYFVLQNIITKS